MKPQFTLEAFADWCEKQPAEKRYAYHNSRSCACGQYNAFLGMRSYAWIDVYWGDDSFWRRANDLAFVEPHTFGALAARLRSVQP